MGINRANLMEENVSKLIVNCTKPQMGDATWAETPRRGSTPCIGWVETRGAPDLKKPPHLISSQCKQHAIKASFLEEGERHLLHSLQMVVYGTGCSHARQEHGLAETTSWPGLDSNTAGKWILSLWIQNKPSHSPDPQKSNCLKALQQGEDALHLLFPSLAMQRTTEAGRQVSIFRAIWHALCFICLSCRTRNDMRACGIAQPSKASPRHCKLILRREEHTKTKQPLSRNAASGEVTLRTSPASSILPLHKAQVQVLTGTTFNVPSCTKRQGTRASGPEFNAAPSPPTSSTSLLHLSSPQLPGHLFNED